MYHTGNRTFSIAGREESGYNSASLTFHVRVRRWIDLLPALLHSMIVRARATIAENATKTYRSGQTIVLFLEVQRHYFRVLKR